MVQTMAWCLLGAKPLSEAYGPVLELKDMENAEPLIHFFIFLMSFHFGGCFLRKTSNRGGTE